MSIFQKMLVGSLVCLLGIGLIWLIDYLALYRSEPVRIPGVSRQLVDSQDAQSINSADLVLEKVVDGIEVPWSIVFTSAERMLITERPGRIRVVENGVLQLEPALVIDEVAHGSGEIGLMGMVKHPEYGVNKHLFACYGYQDGGDFYNKVVLLRDMESEMVVAQTIIDNLPSARNHAGCELGISPDDKLFITVGDGLVRDEAQNLDSLAGKILRLNLDGSIPADNPFVDSPIYSYGHRNPQGLAWHPVSGELYSTEHGPSVFDGPAGGDEINRLIPGGNYGWPLISHEQTGQGLFTGLVVYTPALAPATATFYDAELIPALRGSLLFGGLRGEGMYRVVFSSDNPDQVVLQEKMSLVDVGRVRVVTVGPDGAVYLATSNRDGRGTVRTGDDGVYRLTSR